MRVELSRLTGPTLDHEFNWIIGDESTQHTVNRVTATPERLIEFVSQFSKLPADTVNMFLETFGTDPEYRQVLVRRFTTALSYFREPIQSVFGWVIASREVSNFTYDITELNEMYLASFVAVITGRPYAAVCSYIQEIKDNQDLKGHVLRWTAESKRKLFADSDARYGRRIGWYAFVRALKPQIVIETGVEKGLGTLVISTALMKNHEEGFPGFVFGTDIDPNAGDLLQPPYAEYAKILFGDSLESLRAFDKKIDLFINDSEHDRDYEYNEYEEIIPKLSAGGVILADNAHSTDSLLRVSIKYNRDFLFFNEEPRNHWYPGAGIGASFQWGRSVN